MAIADIIPACLIPPPLCFLKWLALRMNFSSPTNTEPIGAPNDLDKHNETLSKYEQYSLILIPVATLAFHNLAPSKCNLISFSRQNSLILRISSIGIIIPCKVFSNEITLVGAA